MDEIKECNLREVVCELYLISDREYQQRAWFGQSDRWVNSPVEHYCRMCEDLFVAYWYSDVSPLPLEAQRVLREFVEHFEDFGEDDERLESHERVFNDPEWETLRQQARQLVRILEPELSPERHAEFIKFRAERSGEPDVKREEN